jgi:hypothetical protein
MASQSTFASFGRILRRIRAALNKALQPTVEKHGRGAGLPRIRELGVSDGFGRLNDWTSSGLFPGTELGGPCSAVQSWVKASRPSGIR